MATDHNFRVKNGLEVGGQEVISSSGVITSAALGGQTLGTTDSPTFANATLTGSLRGPSTFTIDPAAVGDNTGTLVIAGNLQVDGTTTTINSTTMEVDDLNITLASGAANAAAANGAGITVDGAGANITYVHSTTSWDLNKPVNVTGAVDCLEVLVGNQNSRFAENNLRFLSAGTAYIDHSTVGQSIDFRASVSSALDTTVLQVNGNGYVYIRGLRISGADGSVNQIWQSTSNAMLGISANGGDINFGQTSGSIMRLKPSGNVGIGTTDPNAALQIGKGISSGPPAAGASTAAVCFGNDTSANAYGLVMGADGFGKGYISAQRTDGTATTYDLLIQPNGGNVGIGTTSPSAKLDVYQGELKVTGTLANWSVDSQGVVMDFTRASTSYIRASNAAGQLQFQTGGSNNHMIIASSGNVGIGNTGPTNKLSIGQNLGTGFAITADSGTAYGMVLQTDEATPTANPNFWVRTNDGNAVSTLFRIQNNGLVGIGTSSPTHALTVADENGGGSDTRRITIKSQTHGPNSGYRFDSESSNGTARGGGYYFQPGDTEATTYLGLSATDAAYQMVITREGNVGIGTDAPDYTVHAYRSDDNASIYITNSSTKLGMRGDKISLERQSSYSGGQYPYIQWLAADSTRGAYFGWGNFTSSGTKYIQMQLENNHEFRVGGGPFRVNQDVTYLHGNSSTTGTVNLIADSSKGSNESHIHYGSTGDWYIRSSGTAGKVVVQDQGQTAQTVIGSATPQPGTTLTVSNGAISHLDGNNDLNTHTYSSYAGLASSGTIEFTVGYTGTLATGRTFTFTYSASTWKSWFCEIEIAGTGGYGVWKVGGYNNGGGGYDTYETHDGSATGSIVATYSGQSNIITLTLTRQQIHPGFRIRYFQSGGDGAPRMDRTSWVIA